LLEEALGSFCCASFDGGKVDSAFISSTKAVKDEEEEKVGGGGEEIHAKVSTSSFFIMTFNKLSFPSPLKTVLWI
jgi:hypothetical protein